MLLLDHATIHTLDSRQPQTGALLIDHGQIVAWGAAAKGAAIAQAGAATRIDLGGRAVIPGLTDAHLHLDYYAFGLQKVDCETATRAECLRRVAERAANTPPGEWVLGHGWNHNRWDDGYGSAAELDVISGGRPVFLTAKSLHAAWANSAALRLAGVGANTPDPDGGRIGRTPAGAPDGTLFESAMTMVAAAVPEPGEEELAAAIVHAQGVLARLGITGIHDFDRRRCFAALQLLHGRGDLRMRVVKNIPLELLPQAAELGLRTGFGDDWLRIGAVKCFADGALGPQTAAMFAPYENSPDNHGMLLMDNEEIYEHGRMAVGSGLALTIHAIGDRAVHEVLEAYQRLRADERAPERAGAQHNRPPLRHRIEHVQVIHPDDAHRLGELGVIASMQPIHATSDMLMADHHWGERAALSYAWRTQLAAGAVLAFGSDAPVESPNPFWGLHAAVTRRGYDGAPGENGWRPEQKLSLEEALAGFTVGAAFAAGMENRLGRLAPGCLADLLVLPSDPFTMPPHDLKDLLPDATMVGGEWIYRDNL